MTETPVLIPWAPGAQYTKVICRLGEPRPDGSDVDEYPDLMTQGGTVTITCAAKKIRYSESDDRARMLTTRPWTFKIRPSDGELYNPESGAVGVHVLSGNSTGVDPTGFTWSATVTPDNGESWTVTIPANAGASIDLVSIVDIVAPSAGESTLSQRVKALEDAGPSSGGPTASSAVVTVPNIGWTDSTTLTVAGLTGPHVVAPVTAEGAQAWAAGQWWASSPADGQLTITGTIQPSADPVDVRVVWWE